MTTASILTLLSTVASLLPTIENAGQVVLTFAYGAISAVEQTGKTGDEKLAAVLNGAETAFKGLGAEALAADFSAVAAPLEAAVQRRGGHLQRGRHLREGRRSHHQEPLACGRQSSPSSWDW